MAEKGRDAPFPSSPASDPAAHPPHPAPTAAGQPPPASYIRVRTELCESLTMPGWEKLLMEESQPLLQPPLTPRDGFPAPADFALALQSDSANRRVDHRHGTTASSTGPRMTSSRPLPQAIAHRGYKAKFPENTMAAFVGAVDVGAHAIETDVHLSRDGVVVLSHDPTLERCFGRKEKIIDCDWQFLASLRTKAKPHEPIPRLADLLELMTRPGNEQLWVLLDIKRDNNLDDVMRLIAKTIASVNPSPSRPWTQRVVLGIWSPKYLPFVSKYLSEFPMTYISFSLPCAWYFLEHVPRISFNMYAPVLVGPVGAAFRKRAQRLHRPVFAWTVNKERMMEWSIAKGLDGVVTDEPLKFLEVCKRWEDKSDVKRLDEVEGWTWDGWKIWEVLDLLRVQLFIWLLTPVILWWLRPWGAVREMGRQNKAIDG